MGSSSPSRGRVFDPLRGVWVTATPEEVVRQRWLKAMVDHLEYPKELLVVEKGIKELPHLAHVSVPQRRLDIVCYGKEIHPSFPLYPLLLIECKQGKLTQDALNQVIGYNHHVKAYFAAVVSFDEVRLSYFDRIKNEHLFYAHLPSFKELMQWVKP